jgi:hypothetical protein
MTSVVVPVYDGAHVLDWTVPAVLALRGVDEVVWVDDGSTDGTADVLAALLAGHPHARAVRLGENRGRAAARNVGATATHGDVLVFLDADVRPPEDLVERFVSAIRTAGAVATVARLTFPGLDLAEPYGLYLARHPRGVPRLAPGAPVSWKHFVTTACAVRRGAFQEVGGFDERVDYGEDLALACALAAAAPHGLVASGATAEMTDAGTLDTALAKVAAFGQALPRLAERSPDVYRIADLTPLIRPTFASRLVAWRPLARTVRRLLPYVPAPGRVRAVRYLLGHTLLHAHADARLHARSRR